MTAGVIFNEIHLINEIGGVVVARSIHREEVLVQLVVVDLLIHVVDRVAGRVEGRGERRRGLRTGVCCRNVHSVALCLSVSVSLIFIFFKKHSFNLYSIFLELQMDFPLKLFY